MSFHIALIHPQIPSNTGNIGRLCVATGSHLHLVKPLGFSLEDKHMRRAGLDYWKSLNYSIYDNYKEWEAQFSNRSCYFLSTKSTRCLYEACFKPQDVLVFGSEDRGLDSKILENNKERCFRIPMVSEARSLNLSNSVSVVLYEAIRQQSPSKIL